MPNLRAELLYSSAGHSIPWPVSTTGPAELFEFLSHRHGTSNRRTLLVTFQYLGLPIAKFRCIGLQEKSSRVPNVPSQGEPTWAQEGATQVTRMEPVANLSVYGYDLYSWHAPSSSCASLAGCP